MDCPATRRKTAAIYRKRILTMKNTFLKLWGVPMLLAALSLFGLIAALLGDGLWDYLGWIALSVPLFLVIRHYYK